MKKSKYSGGKNSTKKNRRGLFLFTGVFLGFALFVTLYQTTIYFSSNQSCMMCHVHPHADEAWRMGNHGGANNRTGVQVSCIDCHLPPRSQTWAHYTTKARMGLRHVWGKLTRDAEHWEQHWDRSLTWEEASRFVFSASCMQCHTNLFPQGISDAGIIAHLHFEENHQRLNLQCIACHLDAGHYNPNFLSGQMVGIPGMVTAAVDSADFFTEPAIVTAFANFTEQIPGTPISFNMIAIPGGQFTMGSPANEPFRNTNEGPQHEVQVSSFFMAEVQTTWDMFWEFYRQTMSEGRTPPDVARRNNEMATSVDGISGPTPPWGAPDQGWGMADRPAITMTHYAAQVFTQWLSFKTGRNYRLPTEAEWEFAARGGTETAYFFPGNPRDFTSGRFWRRARMEGITPYVFFDYNSNRRTHPSSELLPNPFGLRGMLGNVFEYTADRYNPNAFQGRTGVTIDPIVTEGTEGWVIRGGYFGSDAAGVRSAFRTHTRSDDWLRTDPQQPRSIWWYSDFRGIGFRVVLEPDPELLNLR